jgi:hypothetical protein
MQHIYVAPLMRVTFDPGCVQGPPWLGHAGQGLPTPSALAFTALSAGR